jgi:outer membrane receptor protein involved in Fe transport
MTSATQRPPASALRLFLGVSAAAIAASLSTAAIGQTSSGSGAGGSRASTIQELVVTANKREEKLHDVAMGVTALAGATLEVQQITNFQDFAPLVPGLSLESAQPGSSRITLRGESFGTAGGGSTAAIYIDESPIGSSNALAAGGVATADMDTFDLQRVEVLRGPQGTLYGANSLGGLLKFIPNGPNLSSFGAQVEAGLQNVNHGQTAGDIKAMVNLPFLDGKAALRVSGYADQMPGYVDDPQLHLNDVNRGKRYGMHVSLLYKPTDDLTIKLAAIGQNFRTEGTPSIDVVGAAGASFANPPANQLQPINGLNQNLFQEGYFKDRFTNYSASVVWNPGPVSLTSITSYGMLKFGNLSDATSSQSGLTSTNGVRFRGAPFNQGPNALPKQLQSVALDKFTQELRLASKPGETLEWQAGAFYTREVSTTYQIANSSNALPTALTILAAQLEPVYTEGSVFFDATYHFTPQFDVEAGGRYSTNWQHAVQTSLPGIATTGISAAGTLNPATFTHQSSNASDFTYSVAPRYHFSDDTLLYARVATGYRPGGPNSVPPGAPAGFPTQYGADKTFNYEVGLRTDLFDKMLSIDVAAFHITWKNIQLSEKLTINNLNFSVNGNGGNARNQGVEWTIGAYPIKGLTLTWTGAYTDAVLTSLNPETQATLYLSSTLPGAQLPFVPKWQTALNAQYTWPLFSDYDGFVGGTYAYEGERFTDFATAGSNQPTHVAVPSYSTLALRAGVENDRYRVEIFGKNLGDARGITAYGSNGHPNFTGAISIIQPRTIGVLVSAKF